MPPRSSSKSRGASKSAAAAAPASPTTLVAATSPKLAAGGELRAGRKKQHAVPVPPATLTMREIHAQIPAPYFQRHMWKGFLYVARDLAQSAATVAAMVYGGLPLIEAAEAALPAPAAWAAKAAVWMLFWFVQGLNWTGLWVLAHECGHQAFSASRAVNDAVGLVLHSALLVPYHSWRISHGNHHKNTNHLTKDTVFVPAKRETLVDHARESPIVSVFFMIVTFTLGWPAYLFANVASQDYGRRANHFEPSSPLFRPDERADVIVSDLGIAAMLTALVAASLQFGALNVFLWYGAPYMWVNFWLIFITYLQHTDVRVPHYAPEDWTFVRGALATVDRDFGAALNWWLHHINDSHVVHHIFSQMPFYHAIEVTRKHLPAILGPLYLRDARPLRTALWESWLECRYVIPTEGVAVYHE